MSKKPISPIVVFSIITISVIAAIGCSGCQQNQIPQPDEIYPTPDPSWVSVILDDLLDLNLITLADIGTGLAIDTPVNTDVFLRFEEILQIEGIFPEADLFLETKTDVPICIPNPRVVTVYAKQGDEIVLLPYTSPTQVDPSHQIILDLSFPQWLITIPIDIELTEPTIIGVITVVYKCPDRVNYTEPAVAFIEFPYP